MAVSVSPAPARSLEQRLMALQRANRIRSYRAQLKRDLKAGTASFLTVLAAPPAECESMRVRDLLVAIPKVGRVKADKVLKQTKTSPSKTLAGLTDRQRMEIASALRYWSPR